MDIESITKTEISKSIFACPDYKRSRTMYMAQCAIGYFVTILAEDAFLVKLLTNIGISDSLIGVISSIISLAFLFQLLSVVIAQKKVNTKKTVILFLTASQLLLAGLYCVPFMPFSVSVKTIVVVLCVLFSYICNYIVSSILFKWANSYVEPAKRGEYSAVKEMVSLISGIVFTLVIGWVIDRYESIGNIRGGFLFISASILVLTLSHFVSLVLIKGDTKKENACSLHSFSDITKNIFCNRNFVRIIVLNALWEVARYMTIGFLGTFKTNDLSMTVVMIQVINMIGNFGRILFSVPFGKYSDKHSYVKGMKLALILAAIAFGFNIFVTPSTWWFIVIYTVLYNISMAGSNQNSFNITYSYIKSDYFVYAMAIKNSIGGICGFCASLVGSKILNYIQENGNTFLGVPMYGQQLLSLVSLVITVIAVLFIQFKIEKQKVMVQ